MNQNRIKEYTLENGLKVNAYIPQNVTSETPVFYYSYVVGNNYQDDKLWHSFEENMAKYDADAIIVIPQDRKLVIGGENVSTHIYQNNAVNAYNLIKEDYNLTNNQLINGGFSAGFGYGTRTLAHYLEETPVTDRQVLIAVDGVINPTANLESSELQTLKDNNTMIISYSQQRHFQNQAKLLKESNLPIIYVVDESIPAEVSDDVYWGYHDQVAKDFFEKGVYKSIIDFSQGKGDINLPSGFSLKYYDPTTGEIKTITKEEATKILNITKTSSEGISSLRLSKLSSIQDLKLESNNEVLENKLNEIRSEIRNTNFLTANTSLSFESTTKIPSEIKNVVNSYIEGSLSLLEKLESETTQFAKIGSSIVELDQETAKESENLSNLLTGVGAPTVLGNTITNTNTQTNTETINNQTPSSNTNSNSTNTQTTNNNTSSNPSSYTPLNNTSLNNSDSNYQSNNNNSSSNNNTSNNTNQNNQPSEEKTGIETFHDYDKLVSDDTKIVYNCNDEYKIVVHKDGDKIIGIEHYYDFGTESSAQNAMSTLQQQYNTTENFDKIIQKDRYIKVLFNENEYKDLTISDIKTKYATLAQI